MMGPPGLAEGVLGFRAGRLPPASSRSNLSVSHRNISTMVSSCVWTAATSAGTTGAATLGGFSFRYDSSSRVCATASLRVFGCCCRTLNAIWELSIWLRYLSNDSFSRASSCNSGKARSAKILKSSARSPHDSVWRRFRAWNSAAYSSRLLSGSNRLRRAPLALSYVDLASVDSRFHAVCALPVSLTRSHNSLVASSHPLTCAEPSKCSIHSSQLPSPEKASGLTLSMDVEVLY
jgi:hypothetical protein